MKLVLNMDQSIRIRQLQAERFHAAREFDSIFLIIHLCLGLEHLIVAIIKTGHPLCSGRDRFQKC